MNAYWVVFEVNEREERIDIIYLLKGELSNQREFFEAPGVCP